MTPLQGTATGQAHGITKVSYTHDAMIDQILLNPGIKQGELALYFGYSEGWVSRVMGSDAFQARLAQRKEEAITPQIRANLEERLAVLADQSLTVLQTKLKATSSAEIAVKTLELSTKALGLGARPEKQIQTTNNYVVALPPKAQDETSWAAQARQQVNPVRSAQGVVDVVAKPGVADGTVTSSS